MSIIEDLTVYYFHTWDTFGTLLVLQFGAYLCIDLALICYFIRSDVAGLKSSEYLLLYFLDANLLQDLHFLIIITHCDDWQTELSLIGQC